MLLRGPTRYTCSIPVAWMKLGKLFRTLPRAINAWWRYGKSQCYFSETRLRGYIFHVARQCMRDGDWFLRVDADEFHHVVPPEFVNTRLQRHETVVFHQYYDFRLLQSEVDAWNRGKETRADRQLSIEDRRQHYTVSIYADRASAVTAARCGGRRQFHFRSMRASSRASVCLSDITPIAIPLNYSVVAGCERS